MIEEILALQIMVRETFRKRDQYWRESLRHPKHATVLDPLSKRLQAMIVRRWRKQQREFLREADHWLQRIAKGHQEADADEYKRLQAQVKARINAGTALNSVPSRKDSAVYNSVIESSATGAIRNLSIDLDIEAAEDAGQSFARTYLAKNGFTQLAADIDDVTRDRMANAVAQSFSTGGTYQDAVKAIKGAFDNMKDSRAETIAKTELADAYNQAMVSSAKEAGDELLKVWNLDGEGCEEICQPNADDGPIGLDEDFSSGDDAPPAHPNCDCSIGFVKASET